MAWSDPVVQKLAKQFVPCADEVWFLDNRKGPDCEFFRKACEGSVYSASNSTQQGVYAVAPGGELLGAINSRKIDGIKRMLQRSLAKWNDLPDDRRYASKDFNPKDPRLERSGRRYPEKGLILRVNSRDLPRKVKEKFNKWSIWQKSAWNQDYAWFQKQEARRFLPEEPKVGDVHEVPAPLIRRLVMLHLVDNVRGQTSYFSADQVRKANLISRVTGITGNVVSIRLEGETRTGGTGKHKKGKETVKAGRGYESKLLGFAQFDLNKGRFVSFEMVAMGERWGGTRFNRRASDPGPEPMGILVTLAGEEPWERVSPAFLWMYKWMN